MIGDQAGAGLEGALFFKFFEAGNKAVAPHVAAALIPVHVAAVCDHGIKRELFEQIPALIGEPACVVGDQQRVLLRPEGVKQRVGRPVVSLKRCHFHAAVELKRFAVFHTFKGHAAFDGDVRYGVNVVDITLMECGTEEERWCFKGFAHDEDPDFFYDAAQGRWYMAICRSDPENGGKYRYAFFTSDQPFDGYTLIGRGKPGEETGGSFVRIGGKTHFVCGNGFSLTSNYRIYDEDGMSEAKFNFPDGGFRGWGTVIPVKQGTRMRYYWLTFDRHRGSDYNWSYGNFYCFEGFDY